jgi:hypothetical protein
MKKSLPLAMPGATALCALIVVAAVVGLAGCTDKHVTEVKALPFSYPSENVPDPNMTVDQALDYRKICDSIKWKVDETEQHQTFVQYTCTYKGVEDSAFIAASRALHPTYGYTKGVSDIYQWVYGADGKPQFQYVALQYHYSDGTVKNVTSPEIGGGLSINEDVWATALMQQAVKNADMDYDHFRSALYGIRIPPKPKTVMQAPTATQVTETRKEATTASRPDSTADSVAAAMSSTTMTPPASAPIAAPVASTAAASAPTSVAADAAVTPSNVPADDPSDIALMTERARKAAGTSDEDAIDEQYIDPSTSVAMWAGRPRKDGYPAYAAACDITAKAICRQYNGMGNPTDVPIQSVIGSLTVVRNADVLSGKYFCGEGICLDKKVNLVGRVSAAMAQAHPELMQAHQQ